MIPETIQEIMQQLGVAATEMIPHYTKWFFAAAIGWIIFGCLFIFVGFLVFRWLWNWKDETVRDMVKITAVIFLVVWTLIGFLIIGSHIGDLASPEGIAYHQLIKDIRGQ